MPGEPRPARHKGVVRQLVLVASCHRSCSERELRTLENTRAPAAMATTIAMIFFMRSSLPVPVLGSGPSWI